MAEAESNNIDLSLNADTMLEVSVHDLEHNTELVVLPKGRDDSKNDNLGTDDSENATKVINRRSADETCGGEADATCDDKKSSETKTDSGGVNFNARSIKEKYGSNTYVVSGDDYDRNAQSITIYRGEVIDVSDNSDSSDSDTSSTVSDDNDDSDNVSSSDKSESEDKQTNNVTRTKGELTLHDLPPIEDLKISVDENKCKPIGSVLNIVDEMVVIQSFPNTPPLDIDTVLFLDRGQRALGKIFDVFGPVQEPFYSVRFNSREHVLEKDIRREQVVYCAPQTEYTSYIPVSQLLKEKGSDASWTHNNEPPVTCLDFSDDEAEARHKRPKVNTGSKRDAPSDNDLFVKKMNQKNLELTAKRKKEDEAKQKRGSVLRKAMTCHRSQPGESVLSVASHSFAPFSKSRNFSNSSNGDQTCSSSFFHHPAASAVLVNTHTSSPSKFESGPAPRSMNYLRNAAAATAAAVSYTPAPLPPPLNYTFPSPQHFICSPPRQLPNQPQPPSTAAAAAAAATQNYLAMYHHQRTSTVPTVPTTALSMVPSPFSHFTAATMPSMPTFVTQPQPQSHQAQPQQQTALHPAMPPSFNAAVPPPPPPFANFNPLPTPPLSTSLPQPNFFATRTDTSGPSIHHQASFIPLSMRPAVPPTFHPQFVLPPPPPPPPPPVTLPHTQPAQQQHQRDVSTASRMLDRRIQPQSSHQTTNTFYPNS